MSGEVQIYMVTINIPEKLARTLEKVAQRENRSLDELAVSILEDHLPGEAVDETPDSAEDVNPLDSIMGMFDDDVTDMSTTVKETMQEYYKNKKWKS